MRRSDSPFTGLSPVEAKRLHGQLKDYLRDYPELSGEELADVWHDEQESLAEGTWLEPYLEGGTWEREVPRAIASLRRDVAYKAQAKVYRQQAKERNLDRQPATPRQKKLLTRLTKRMPNPPEIESLSKLKASQLIQQLLIDSPIATPDAPR
ncbi:hypothetical protein D3C86_598600 [compost metagenome]